MKKCRTLVDMGGLFGNTDIQPVSGLTSNGSEVCSDDKFEWKELPQRRVLPVMTDWARFLEDPRAVHQLDKTV